MIPWVLRTPADLVQVGKDGQSQPPCLGHTNRTHVFRHVRGLAHLSPLHPTIPSR